MRDNSFLSKLQLYIFILGMLTLPGILFSCNQKPNYETTSVVIPQIRFSKEKVYSRHG